MNTVRSILVRVEIWYIWPMCVVQQIKLTNTTVSVMHKIDIIRDLHSLFIDWTHTQTSYVYNGCPNVYSEFRENNGPNL